MPYTVRKRGPKKWAIVNKQTGRVVGHSRTKKDAQASARIRNGAHRR